MTRRQLGDIFADSAHQCSTLVELLRYRASEKPKQVAYTFLSDDSREITLTYGDLNRRARATGALLESLQARNEQVLLIYPAGLEFIPAFFGCMYAGAIAVPAFPPDPARLNRTLPRLQAIAADAQCRVVLTRTPILQMTKLLFSQAPELAALQWVADDNLTGIPGEGSQECVSGGEVVAFLQYTSGSTGVPKGVMLTHANLLHNASLVYHALHSSGDKYVSWLPTFHDMGFMAGILQPIYAGIPGVLMPPASFLQTPVRWLETISKHKGTISGGPNFAYDLCVRKIKAEQKATLDLSSWRVAFNGAEPVRPETMERFTAAFEPCGFRPETFYPCYGLAEATLIVSGGTRDCPPVVSAVRAKELESDCIVKAKPWDKDVREFVGCGKSLMGQRIIIVNPESLVECGPDEVGEILVSGRSVAQGYWNRSNETQRTFRAHLSSTGEGPFLRTGDLGFLSDGELFVTGRLKDLIIIRGANHYPQDIELTVEQCHRALRQGCGAAFSVDIAGEEKLVVVQEVDSPEQCQIQEIIEAITQSVSDKHDLHLYAVVVIKPGTIPKTSSGKIQRQACRAQFLEGRLEEVGRCIPDEPLLGADEESLTRESLFEAEPAMHIPMLISYLQKAASRLLKVSASRMDPQKPLAAYGLDSLMSVELMNKIEIDLKIDVPAVRFLQSPGIAQLADEMLNTIKETQGSCRPPAPSETQGITYPLSQMQRSIWFLCQLAPESAAYNIPFAARIHSEVDVPALEKALQRLIDRHHSLRTIFATIDGQPVQRVANHVKVRFTRHSILSNDPDELNDRLSDEAYKPFNLERGPVCRADLFSIGATEHILLITVHHLAIDGWSFWVLLEELGLLFRAAKAGIPDGLSDPPLKYVDYVRLQEEMLASPEGERLRQYWEEVLEHGLSALDLATARPRSPILTHRGASHAFVLDEQLSNSLRELAKSEATTLYTILLAAYQVLLSRYSGQQDFVIASPTSARSKAEFDETIGCFFNMVLLRADLSGDPRFKDFLTRTRRTVLGALEHQDYPLHLLAERLQLRRDASRPHLFQVTFILQKPHTLMREGPRENGMSLDLGGLIAEMFVPDRRFARQELELEMLDLGGTIYSWFHYDADLFDRDQIVRMAAHFSVLLEGIVANPLQRITTLPLITQSERQQLMSEWSSVETDYPYLTSVSHLFKEQAARTPEKAAAVSVNGSLSFRDLDEQAEKLARLIRELKGQRYEESAEQAVQDRKV